ncbi:major facilitator superfamily domain-containing protein [Zychaea mexicana]|uniref:major facilitator superfamily domain-containing protein n=1 Tax=Zychaea mexicana TaxID=64656 RepID=UPI0022FF2558|nr:major facilitator superfamily domain-containing protein [Zychaea mexicana]KAI9492062.1 major facilitator superfamily domain-containing protein [Zychaea mexicana]
MIQFVSGLNDGNLGIILPSIKAHYGLNQYVVSIIFLCNAAGYMTAAVLNGYLIRSTSQSKTALLGACSMIVGYLVNLFAVPFPVMCIFMTTIGFGIALTQAAANVVCGEMPYGMLMLSFLHAFYAGGALVGPLLASGLLSSQKPWNTSYMVFATTVAASTTTPSDQESMTCKEQANSKNTNLLSQIFKFRITSIGAVFLLFYTGTEVTIGNWGYTYLISTRSTDTNAMAHLMTGYWAGICAGRLFLGFATSRFGEKRMVYCYLAMIVVMMVLLWLLPYIGANATSLVITGIMLGPIFPTVVSVAHNIVPTHLYATCVGFLSAFASAGTALFPYATGVLIGAEGVSAMLPFCIATSCAMLIMWFFVPDPRPPTKFSAKMRTWKTQILTSIRS